MKESSIPIFNLTFKSMLQSTSACSCVTFVNRSEMYVHVMRDGFEEEECEDVKKKSRKTKIFDLEER